MSNYGATYATEDCTFGKVQRVFPVANDWDGYKHHGHMSVPPLICLLLANGSISRQTAVDYLNEVDVDLQIVPTAHWCRYSNESESCGGTLRIFENRGKYLLLGVDPQSGGFSLLLSVHEGEEQAEAAMYDEAHSDLI